MRAALQTSPDGLVAFAVMRSLPAGLASRRSIEKDPLGGFVVALVMTALIVIQRQLAPSWAISTACAWRS